MHYRPQHLAYVNMCTVYDDFILYLYLPLSTFNHNYSQNRNSLLTFHSLVSPGSGKGFGNPRTLGSEKFKDALL